jgi:hypothetical protein
MIFEFSNKPINVSFSPDCLSNFSVKFKWKLRKKNIKITKLLNKIAFLELKRPILHVVHFMHIS